MTPDAFAELTWRGLVHQVTDDDLGGILARGPMVLYHGIDVTADSLHVGSLLGIMTLRRLQQAGHRPVVLVGGGTTRIGDPSGKRQERPVLSEEEIAANTAGIRAQLERLLDFGSGGPGSTSGGSGATLVDNSEWLGGLGLVDFLRDVGRHFTVNSMVAKESVRSRFDTPDQGISFTEFSYMLLQAYDFLHLFDARGARLQVGGSDQWGNITAGVDLIRRTRREAAYGLTWPLVTKADGTKFGKSEAGNVWLDPGRTSPYAFHQFWLNTDDADVGRMLRQYTFLTAGEIEALEAEVTERPQARAAQRALAREVTTAVHGVEATEGAEQAAAALFTGDLASLDTGTLLAMLADAPSSQLAGARLAAPGLALVELLAEVGLAASRSEARTLVSQGAVRVNDVRVAELDATLGPGDLLDGGYLVLRRGRRHHHLVRFS